MNVGLGGSREKLRAGPSMGKMMTRDDMGAGTVRKKNDVTLATAKIYPVEKIYPIQIEH